MATIREGDQTALLIVDMQVVVIDGAWQEDLIIASTRRAVEKAREKGVPIIWIQHESKSKPHGSPGWQIVPQLAPHPDEICLDKHFNSAFEESGLEETLSGLGTTHIVLAGVLTNWCLQATAYAALDRGYDLTLIGDAHTTEDFDFDNGESISAANIIEAFNILIGAVRYPGRTNRVISVEDLEF